MSLSRQASTREKPFVLNLQHYANNEQSRFTLHLRSIIKGYENNDDNATKRTRLLRQEYIRKVRDTHVEDEAMSLKLRRMDLMYRLFFSEDVKLRGIMLNLKTCVRNIGIDIVKAPEHSEKQHQLRQVEYYSGIYKMFKEAQETPDEDIVSFMRLLSKDYEPKYKLTRNEQPFHELIGLFYRIEEMQLVIMESAILSEASSDPSEPVKSIKEFTIIDQYKKKLEYADVIEDNLLGNKSSFHFGYDLLESLRPDAVNKSKEPAFNHVREFFNLYEDMLRKKSRDYWQFLLFDSLKLLCDSKNSDDALQEMLFIALDDFDAVGYLLSNRKDIVAYLKKDLMPGETVFILQNEDVMKAIGMQDVNVEKQAQMGGRRQDTEKQSQQQSQLQEKKVYDGEAEFTEVDFIRQDQSQLVQRFPTLDKNETPEYVQIKIPPMPRVEANVADLVNIKQNFPRWAQTSFGRIDSLNRIQSKVYKGAFLTDENILICAPTGAGKTNIALMTIMHELEKHINPTTNRLTDASFKIIYISPMKALAAEIVEKFSTMLANVGVICKELTGDMQLTKKEIEETHIIVTTPEKWDVYTRKKNEVAETLKLLIIDEIHLLNDERGSVLECLVSRTLQNIERQQKSVRMLGLSATLPNYLDVAAFLHVKKDYVYFFDSTYRPVPLMQRYVGVKDPKQGGKTKRKKLDIYNDLTYTLSKGILEHKKQVLIFVHSRKETVFTAQFFLKKATDSNDMNIIKPMSIDRHVLPKIKDRELIKLAPYGIGFHHAGMLRADRNIVEKMFNDGNIRVLVATATLAWGVNLPAYGVIIKGTDIYDPSRGGVQDLSVLDIQQMFGRAGRPQFDNNGEATLITDINKLNSFAAQLNNASFIESRFSAHLREALNAEIALGNITNLKEAFDWVNYTFYAIRLRRNPMGYGCRVSQNKELSIEMHITDTIEMALEYLDKLRLIRWDRNNNYLASTELGRTTSHYYINCETMNTFCKGFGIQLDNDEDVDDNEKRRLEVKSDLGILKILAQAKEFENIKVRPEEMEELATVIKKFWVFDEHIELNVKRICATDNNVDDDTLLIDTPEKILALMSGYLSKYQYENFSLISDSMFVVQNSIRLLRCMLDIVTKKSMAYNAEIVYGWCKFLENRLIPDETPLHQFCKSSWSGYNSFKQMRELKDGFLSEDVIRKIDDIELSLDQIHRMSAQQVGDAINWNAKVGSVVKKFATFIPKVDIEYAVKPIAQTVLKVDVKLTPKWQWSNRWHSKSELFTLTVDDENEILHSESFTIGAHQVFDQIPTEMNFFVPFQDSRVPYYRLSVQHDTWVNTPETEIQMNLDHIIFHGEKIEYTELLDLHPLPTSALNNPQFEKIYRMKFFNPNQTQLFHSLYNTDHNVLIGSPTGSGKTIMAEFAVLRVFSLNPDKKVVYIAPLKALARERLADWEIRFGKALGKTVLELTGDFTPDVQALLKADVLITTPEKWDGISRNWNNRAYVQKTGLVVFDEIHLLGQDRGPVLEVIVSRMNLISSKTGQKVRMIGLSTAMANGQDVADWFGVPKNYFFNFRPHVRPVPIKIYFDGFSGKAYTQRMAEMNKPTYQMIRKYGDKKPVLVFVSSRRQTHMTALDLIGHAIKDAGSGQSPYVMCQEDELQLYLEAIKDEYLKQTLSFGVGMHHAGLDADDKKIVEELFLNHKIQVLVATSTLAWGVNLPARLVIIKGTEYFDPKTQRYVDMPVTDILQMIGRAGRPQFDDKGIACVFVEQSKKNFYRKYLNDPFPIESSLIGQIHDHFNAEIASGTIKNKQQCMDWITWTYFFRRMLKNPAYYNLDTAETSQVKEFVIKLVDGCVNRLAEHNCITIDEDQFILSPTFLGQLAAFYYIKHESIAYFSKHILNATSIPELLRILSYSKEFEDIPLRHNEDKYNEALAKTCPFKCDKNAFNTSNEKTFLLYQIHLFRLPPPIRDYINDMKAVIDNSTRIINAMIDLAAEKRLLNTCLNLCMIVQMISQALWIDQNPLVNIPYFDNSLLKKLELTSFKQLIEQYKANTLRDSLRKVENKKFSDDNRWRAVENAVKSIPDIRMNASISDFKAGHSSYATITVNIERVNSNVPLKVIMHSMQKIKDASWWILIGDQSTGNLFALKKIFFKDTLTKEIRVFLSKETAKQELSVFLVSDSYLGLDQVCQLRIQQKEEAAAATIVNGDYVSLTTITGATKGTNNPSKSASDDSESKLKLFPKLPDTKNVVLRQVEEPPKKKGGKKDHQNQQSTTQQDAQQQSTTSTDAQQEGTKPAKEKNKKKLRLVSQAEEKGAEQTEAKSKNPQPNDEKVRDMEKSKAQTSDQSQEKAKASDKPEKKKQQKQPQPDKDGFIFERKQPPQQQQQKETAETSSEQNKPEDQPAIGFKLKPSNKNGEDEKPQQQQQQKSKKK